MKTLDQIIMLSWLLLTGAGIARAQDSTLPKQAAAKDVSGIVVNYNANPAQPLEGIVVYHNGVAVDTTDASGTFGVPTAIEPGNRPVVPDHFTLKTYPNPFNSQVTIEYTVPSAATVSFRWFTPTAQKLTEQRYQHAQPGTYRVTFSPAAWASGAYFLQALITPKAGTHTESKTLKLLYIK